MRRFASILVGSLVATASADAALASLAPGGEEIVVNAYTSGTQRRPAVAPTGDGGFIVVWQDARPEVTGIHVRGQRFDASGAPLGSDFQVDAEGTSSNERPDVAATGSDAFVVVWRREHDNVPRIVGRQIDGDGVASDTEFQVNTPRPLEGSYYLGGPAVAPAQDGGFEVVWASGAYVGAQNEHLDSDILGRRFDAGASPAGADVFVLDFSAPGLEFVQQRPDISAEATGSFLVTWLDHTNSQITRIRVRRLDAAGVPQGGDTSTIVEGGGDSGPRLVTTGSNDFHLLRRRDTQVRSLTHGDEILVASGIQPVAADPSEAREVAGALLDEEDYAVAWASGGAGVQEPASGASDGEGAGVFARAFDPEGHPLSPVRQVNVTTAGDQLEPELVLVAESKLVAAWTSNGSDPGDVFVRVIDVVTPECGDGNEDGKTSASDALLALQAAVGSRECPLCVCDADGSGRHVASDALLVLRASVGIDVTFACPLCGVGLGSPFHFTGSDCSNGVHAEIPRDALPEDLALLSCSAEPQIAAADCSVTLTKGEDGLVYDQRACSPLTRPLFRCIAPEGAAAAMAAAAHAACGCGCQEQCQPPQLCAEIGATETCSPATSVVARLPVQPTSIPSTVPTTFTTVQQVSTSSSSSTSFCGTCCHLTQSGPLAIDSDVTLSEIVIRVQGDVDDDCFFCDHDGRIVRVGDATDFCLLGVDAPFVTRCEGHGSFFEPFEVIRAFGQNFEPIDPPPAVVQRGITTSTAVQPTTTTVPESTTTTAPAATTTVSAATTTTTP